MTAAAASSLSVQRFRFREALNARRDAVATGNLSMALISARKMNVARWTAAKIAQRANQGLSR